MGFLGFVGFLGPALREFAEVGITRRAVVGVGDIPMNLTAILLVGALTLAAPVGYLTYDQLDLSGSASAAASPAAISQVAGANAGIRFHHDGTAIDVIVSLARADEEPFDTRTLTLTEGETVIEHALDPAYEYWVSFEAAVPDQLLGMNDAQFGGMASFAFAECPLVDVLIQTFARAPDSGVSVLGAACVPAVERHVGVETSGPSVTFPWPTCPLQCSVGYGFGGAGRLELEVPQGAQRIDVSARWDPESPMTEELSVWLTTPDDECGEGCWVPVAEATGAREVSFSVDEPAPGEYAVATMFTMPAGASLRQDVWLEVVVRNS